ncbi:non-specific lipid transfer protein GPI-anchored 5-like isoform X2 [Carex rostrata]
MAQKMLVSIGVTMTIMAMLLSDVSAQTSGCMTTIVSLSSCLNYISGNSSTPSSSCCSTLSSVVKNEPQCLCMLLNGGASSLGVAINTTKAMELPPACKVQTPPVSLCKTLGAPAAAPSASASPTGTTPSTSSTPSVPSSTTDESTTTGESSDAMSNKSPVISIFFLVVLALTSMI